MLQFKHVVHFYVRKSVEVLHFYVGKLGESDLSRSDSFRMNSAANKL